MSYEFTVEGNFGFPLDMLRHDRCYPKREEDVHEIDPNNQPRWVPNDDLREVTLIGHRVGGPDVAEWKSHGWEVVCTD